MMDPENGPGTGISSDNKPSPKPALDTGSSVFPWSQFRRELCVAQKEDPYCRELLGEIESRQDWKSRRNSLLSTNNGPASDAP